MLEFKKISEGRDTLKYKYVLCIALVEGYAPIDSFHCVFISKFARFWSSVLIFSIKKESL